MRNLHIYTSLWAMQPHDDTGVMLPYDRVCEKVAGAGYHGMCVELGVDDYPTAHEVRPHMEANGLTPLIVAFPPTVDSLEDMLKLAKDFGAPFVDVIGAVTPLTIDEMVPVIETWLEMSDKIGVPIQFETHRNCITNDLFVVLQLLERIPNMQMCADLSHYIVEREFRHPLSDENHALLTRILDRSASFQGRVASRQQIQLQLDFPQHQKWVEMFRDLWREGIANWRARNPQGDCTFVCELGPPEYAMTDANGKEMSNRWEEALVIKGWIEEIWSDLESG